MKRLFMFMMTMAVLLFVVACSNNGSDTNNLPENGGADNDQNNVVDDNENDAVNNETNDTEGAEEEAANQEDMQAMLEILDFYEIELEVSYGPDQEFEVEIEHHSNGDVEAEVEDELNDVDLNDDVEAFNYIYPYVKNLKVSKDMDKQSVIDAVLQAFDLEADYEKFEVEFEFEDGVELEFEDKK